MPAYTTDSEGSTGRRQVVLALLFLGLSLLLVYLPPSRQQDVASVLRESVLRPFIAAQEELTHAREQAVAGGELRSEMDSLVAVLTAHQAVMEENRRLRSLLSLQERIGPGYRPATVIRPGTEGSESMFMLDVGEDQGVRPDAPVVTRHGLLGVIREVHGGTAIGMDWTHPDFRASAMTLDGTTYGIVESRRGDFREGDRLVLNGTAFHTTLEDGTIIVTSGLGGIYPRGIPIGTVEGLAEAEAGWRKGYWLRPMVNPGGATHVLVATATGEGGLPHGDLSPAWPRDSIVTYETLTQWDEARKDSLAALGDSVRILRQVLMAQRAQDSLGRADSAGAVRGTPGKATATPSAARSAPTSSVGREQGSVARSGSAGGSAASTPPPAETQAAPSRPTPARERPATPAPSNPDTGDVTRRREPPGTGSSGGVRQPVIRPALPRLDTGAARGTRSFPTPTDTIQMTPPRDTLRDGREGARRQ